MPDVYSAADRYRERLRARETAVMAELTASYARIDRAAMVELERLVGLIERARAAGEEPRVSWLYRQEALAGMRRVIAQEMERFTGGAAGLIGAHRAATAIEGASAALATLGEGLPRGVAASLVPLRPAVIEQIAGQTVQGAPLRALLAELGPELEQRAVAELVDGVAFGRSPLVIGRRMEEALAGNRARAMTIARTEALRAQREVSHLTYRANAQHVRGWIWWSSLDRRACSSCWAMHGSWHTLEDRLDEHPSGRCTPVPDVRPAPGQDEPPLPRSGPEEFARLPEGARRSIVGSSKHAAMEAGEVDLTDLVERRSSPRWGTTRSESGLAAARRRHGGGGADRPRFMRGPEELPVPSRAHAVTKLVEYSLNANHPAGQHKATVWRSALGFSAQEAELLADTLIRAARSTTPIVVGTAEGWVRYRTVFELPGRDGRRASVVATWQSDAPGAPVRMTTAYVR